MGVCVGVAAAMASLYSDSGKPCSIPGAAEPERKVVGVLVPRVSSFRQWTRNRGHL